MQFEEFDKKLKEAAEHHHPAYSEKAWENMEKLLNKHMPVDKDRRRMLFWVILLFLGLGGTGLLILKPWNNTNAVAVEQKEPDAKEIKNELVQVQTPSPIQDLQIIDGQPIVVPVVKNMPASFAIQPNRPVPQQEKINQVERKDEVKQEKNNESILTNKTTSADDPFSLKTDKHSEPVKTDLTKTPDQPTTSPAVQISQPKKARNKKQHSFFVSLSGGPDLSFVNAEVGKVKLFGGGGIGYTFNNRITVRTGFYSGRKIYSAGPEAYNPPPGFYAYYPYLERVDANCEIYEIPVQLSYHFGKSPERKFFASAGVSSYIMKEEQYKYYYKYSPSGPTVNKTRTLRDKNRHELAGLTVSASYSHKLTRHISLTAEPYVKLPLKGVGYGKVKLNSAGVSMSMNVNPFAKKPK